MVVQLPFDLLPLLCLQLYESKTTLCNFARVSKEFNLAVNPVLYKNIHIKLHPRKAAQRVAQYLADAGKESDCPKRFAEAFRGILPLWTLMLSNPELGIYVKRLSLGEHRWDPLPQAASEAFCSILAKSPNVISVDIFHTIPLSQSSRCLKILSSPDRTRLQRLSVFPLNWGKEEVDMAMSLTSLTELAVYWPEQEFRNMVYCGNSGWYARLEVWPIQAETRFWDWTCYGIHLKSLSLRGDYVFSNLLPLLRSTPDLEELHLGYQLTGEAPESADLLPYLPHLRKLRIELNPSHVAPQHEWVWSCFDECPLETIIISQHLSVKVPHDRPIELLAASHQKTLKNLCALEVTTTLPCLEYLCSSCDALEDLHVFLQRVDPDFQKPLSPMLVKAKRLKTFNFAAQGLDPHQPKVVNNLRSLMQSTKMNLQKIVLQRYTRDAPVYTCERYIDGGGVIRDFRGYEYEIDEEELVIE
ncbi:hypothetical protein FRC03_009187 [Tulasnella sp. 419]|nr:hypothetical protein FRC03_009187 [Tulasnella sp. 419]